MIKKFYHYKQNRNMRNSTYFEKYQHLLELLKNQGVDLGCEPGLVKSELNALGPIVQEIDDTSRLGWLFDARENAREELVAMTFLLTSDRNRYGKLLEDLENQHTQGFHDVFPKNLVEGIPYPHPLTMRYQGHLPPHGCRVKLRHFVEYNKWKGGG